MDTAMATTMDTIVDSGSLLRLRVSTHQAINFEIWFILNFLHLAAGAPSSICRNSQGLNDSYKYSEQGRQYEPF